MKKLFVAALLVVGMTSFAQEKKSAPLTTEPQSTAVFNRNEQKLKNLTAELGLNEAQQKQMSVILDEQSAKRQAASSERKANMEKGITVSPEERKAKMEQESNAVKEKVKKVLTPEQFAKWEDMANKKKEKMQAGNPEQAK